MGNGIASSELFCKNLQNIKTCYLLTKLKENSDRLNFLLKKRQPTDSFSKCMINRTQKPKKPAKYENMLLINKTGGK